MKSPPTPLAGKNHAFCRPPNGATSPNSDEIAKGDFIQIKKEVGL
jgi:hypothetical protein